MSLADFAVLDLPSNIPALISDPTFVSPGFMALSLGLTALFVVLFTLLSLRSKLGERVGAALDKIVLHRAVAWIGFLGFLIGAHIVSLWRKLMCILTRLSFRPDGFPHHAYAVRPSR